MRKPPIPRCSLLVFASTLAVLLPFGGGSAALGTGAASIGVASTIANGQTLTGKVHWTATVSGISTNDVASVAFSIDGVSKWTEKQSPYEYNGTNGTLDTASLSNGSHVFAVVATAKDGSTATAAATATAKNPPQSTRRPSISGQLVAGKTLSAARGSWSGPGPISFSYRWLRCDSSGGSCAAISGAAGSTYTLGDADVGRRLRVVVTATNSAGSSEATSSATGSIRPGAAPPSNTSLPSISGSARDGSLLTASHGNWSNNPSSYAYQWLRCDSAGANCNPIGGANSRQYTVTTGDIGRRLRVAVTASNGSGSTTATSAPTGVVSATGTAPANTSAPSLSGTSREGSTLSAGRGRWTGTEPITYTYQWRRCDAGGNACVDIGGATGSSYRLTPADVGRTVRVNVTGANGLGTTLATSRQTGLIAPAAPASGAIAVAQVSLPDRLVIDGVRFSPNPVRSHATPIVARFHVSDTRGFSVQGALVYALALPYGWARNAPEALTDTAGWATIVVQPTAALPLRRGGALVIFVRARKPGDNLLAGVSARRLVQEGVATP